MTPKMLTPLAMPRTAYSAWLGALRAEGPTARVRHLAVEAGRVLSADIARMDARATLLGSPRYMAPEACSAVASDLVCDLAATVAD